MLDTYKTPVNFRIYQDELVAIFPGDPGTNDPNRVAIVPCYVLANPQSQRLPLKFVQKIP